MTGFKQFSTTYDVQTSKLLDPVHPADRRVFTGDHNSGVISERALNASAVVGWRGWSCDASLVFSPRATHSCETSAQRRKELAGASVPRNPTETGLPP